MENDSGKILGWLPWKRGGCLIFSLRTFKEKKGLDLRLYFPDPESRDWRPTQKGIWVPIEMADKFRKLIAEAFEQLRTLGDTGNLASKPGPPPPPRAQEPAGPSTSSVQGENIGAEDGHQEEESEEDPEDRINKFFNK